MHKVNKFIGVVKSAGCEVLSSLKDLLHVLAPRKGHRILPIKGKYMRIQTKEGLSDADYIKKNKYCKISHRTY